MPVLLLLLLFFAAQNALAQSKTVSDPEYKRLKMEAIVLYDAQQYGLAIQKFDSALMIVPHSKAMLVNRASAKIEVKNYMGAVEDCAAALEIDFMLSEAYFVRGYAWAMLKEFNMSIDDFDQAILLDNTHVDAFYNRAVVRRELQDFAGACKDIDVATQLGYNKAKYHREEFCK